MKICACIIAKNESKNIKLCIDSCRRLAEKVILVDTGSTDDTVQIAESMGAEVYSFSWIDDFAAAKNFALSKATGDWIFFPDADEYIDDDTARMFKAAIKENNKKDIDAITAIIYNIDNRTGEIKKGVTITRVFKNRGSIRYKGRVHEKLINTERVPNAQPNQVILDKAKIYHTGYSEEILPQKHERNLKLLLAVEQSGEGDATNLYYIAGTYFFLERYKETMEYIVRLENHRDYQLLLSNFNLMPNYFVVKALVMLKMPKRYTYDDAISVIKKGEAYYPDHYEVLEQRINIELQWFRLDEALAGYETMIALYDRAEKRTSFSHKRDRSRMLAGMARIYVMKKDMESAFDYYVKAIAMDYTFGIALTGLLDILRNQPPSDVIAFLGRIYDETVQEQRGFLTFVVGGAVMPEVFFYYFNGLTKEDTPKYMRYQIYAYIFNEDYTNAVIAAKKLLTKEEKAEKVKELNVILGLSEILEQYNRSETLKDMEIDDRFIGILEMLIKLDKMPVAERLLDFIPAGDQNTLLEVAELMKNIGYFDAAVDFYQMIIDASTMSVEDQSMGETVLKAREGIAYCMFQKGDREAAKHRYKEIETESRASAQFLKWIDEEV